MARLVGAREELERRNAAVVLVHMGTPEEAEVFLRAYPGARGFFAVADPELKHYALLAQAPARLGQILGPRVLWRGFLATLMGHHIGKPMGDRRQLAGALLIRDDKVVETWVARDVADVPDYRRLLTRLDR